MSSFTTYSSYEKLVQVALIEKKPVVVLFDAAWCSAKTTKLLKDLDNLLQDRDDVVCRWEFIN